MAPADVKGKFVKQCGVLVRDYVPITVQEWIKPSRPGVSYVGDAAKDNLWKMMKVNFIMPEPEPEVNSEGEEQVLDEVELNRRRVLIEEKVKQFALRKMAQQFCNWKKRLNIRYVILNKTPDFNKKMYAKIRDYWEEFKEYKLSEAAKQRSEKNKENAKKKKYHHTMGPGGYRQGIPIWAQREERFLAQGIIPEPYPWKSRVRNWFYGHGGMLDARGKCIYNKRHDEDPLLPIERIRQAVRDVQEGVFRPDRENDELTRALGNKEHKGRTRGTEGSKSWSIGFPEESKMYPDKSHQRRKDLEAKDAREAADRLRNIEALLRDHELRISQQEGPSSQSQRHVEEAPAPSNRKSSVASTEVPVGDDDDALTTGHARRYPVDDITDSAPCDLIVKVKNIDMKVAVGIAIPIGSNPTFHCHPVPEGYAVVGVDQVMSEEFRGLKLDHPAGEDGEVLELGDATKDTILWRKDCIVIPGWTPRPSNPEGNDPSPPPSPPPPSPARQASPPPPPLPSPQRQPPPPSPPSPPRQPSPPTVPPPQKRKRVSTYKAGTHSYTLFIF